MNFSIQDITSAREKIKDRVIKTPLIRSESLGDLLGFEVYLKLENMQTTGSFKYRGAMNKILSLSDEELKSGIICASSGNHGKAVAYACKSLGIDCVVVMPNTAPDHKIKAIKDLGAQIHLTPAHNRFKLAEEIREERNMTMAPPFDDPYIMAGQGTIGLEILEEVDDLDYIITPVSGGGLIGGISYAVKEKSPNTKVLGAEPRNASAYTHSLKLGRPDSVETQPTIADALVSDKPGTINFGLVRDNVSKMLAVSEEYIIKGHKMLLMEGKVLSEFSSAIGIGAILEGLYPIEEGSKVCFVISGGSINIDQLKIHMD